MEQHTAVSEYLQMCTCHRLSGLSDFFATFLINLALSDILGLSRHPKLAQSQQFLPAAKIFLFSSKSGIVRNVCTVHPPAQESEKKRFTDFVGDLFF